MQFCFSIRNVESLTITEASFMSACFKSEIHKKILNIEKSYIEDIWLFMKYKLIEILKAVPYLALSFSRHDELPATFSRQNLFAARQQVGS